MRSLTPQSFPRDRGLSGRIFRKTDRFLSFRGARVFEHALLVLCVTGIVSVIMAGSFAVRQSKTILVRCCEAGGLVSLHLP
jgi:hypothetical protein